MRRRRHAAAPRRVLVPLLGASMLMSASISGCKAKPAAVPMKVPPPVSTEWKPSYPESRTFPDLSSQEWAAMPSPVRAPDADGTDLRIVGRMRVIVREGGVMDRADDLLPVGRASALELPQRLGGGFVFAVITSRGTQVYRADDWLSRLVPLLAVNATADAEGPIVVGFDRLYLRLKSNNDLVAFDAKTGRSMPIGSLPIAPSYGDMVFVDGWRAVVESEVTGLMATFDAGATWKSVPVEGAIRGVTVTAGDPTIVVDGGAYRLDARGQLAFTRAADADDRPAVDAVPAKKTKVSPLGRRPLRAVIEDGYPDEGRTGVVLRGGALARVSLDDGRVVDIEEHAVSETLS